MFSFKLPSACLSWLPALALLLSPATLAAANTATVTPSVTQYSAAGGNVTFTVTLGYTSTLSALDLHFVTPTGWKYVSTGGTNVPQTAPAAEDLGFPGGFDFLYSTIPATGLASFTFTVSYPAGMTGDKVMTGIQANFTDESTGIPAAVTVPNITISPGPSAPAITAQPGNQSIVSGQNTSFTVTALGNPLPSTFAWQRSTDGGSTWVPLTNTAPFSGVTTSTLTITGATVSLTGSRFRVVVGNGVSPDATSDGTATLTVAKATQTISFGTLAPRVFGETFALTATASSGLSVTYVSSNPAVAAVTGSSVLVSGVGTVTLTASQAGNSEYEAAASVGQSLTTIAAAATVTLGATSFVYDGSPKPVSVTTTPSGLSLAVTYDGSSTAPTNAGSYPIVATVTNPNYTGAASGTLTIAKAGQAITFPDIAQKLFSEGTYVLNATGGASGQAIVYSSSDPTVATISGTTVTFLRTGTTTITANQAGTANFEAALPVQRTLTIVPAIQTITFAEIPARTFNPASNTFTVGATATPSGLTVSYASSDETVATVSGNTVTVLKAGTTNLTATQAGNENFGAATPVVRTLVINKGTATVTVANATVTYDGSAKHTTATTVPADLSVALTYNGSTPPTAAGSYAVVATVLSDNYQGTGNGTLVIEKADQTITFDPIAAKTYGDAAFPLTASASSGLPVSLSISDPAVATIASGTVTLVGGGTATVTASQPGDTNYNAATPVARTLTVAKAAATVSLGALSAVYDGAGKAASVTTTPSGLTVTVTYLAVGSGGSASLTPPVNAGSYTVTATINDPRFEGSTSGTLVIAKAAQTIEFAALLSKPFNDPDFILTAVSRGPGGQLTGLPISYTSSDPTVAEIVGANSVDLKNRGTTTITASQPGNENYLAATSVNQVLEVQNAGQTITWAGTELAGRQFGGSSFALVGTASSGLTVAFASDNPDVATITGASVTIVGAGTANVTASQAGDSNFAAATPVVRVLTVAKAPATVTLGSLAATYDGSPKPVTATTTPSGLNVVFSYSLPGTPTAPTNAGSHPVTATIQEANYSGTASGTLAIAKANQTITFAALPEKGLSSPPFALGATASSTLAVSYTSSNPAVASISGSTATLVGTGTTTITASQPGNDNYNAATAVTQSLTVVAVPIVGFPAPGNSRVVSAGTAVSIQLTATPTGTFAFTGNLPPGLTLSGSGLIAGTPTTPGTYTAQVTATNVAGAGPAATLHFTVNPSPTAPVITSAPVVQGQVGVALTYTLASSPAGSTTYVMTGTLPAGLTFNGGAGTVTGTPSAGTAGSYTVFFTGTNASGPGQAADVTFVIAAAAGVPVIVSNGTAAGQVGQPFNYTIVATNGATSYGADGLPAGLSLNSSTGVISGSPTTATGPTPASVLLTATNASGVSAPKILTVTIAPSASSPVITSGAIASGTVGVAFNYQTLATGSPTSYAATNLPAGLGINASTGAITGVPTVAGNFQASLTATNGSGTGPAATLNVTIAPAPTAPAITSPATATAQVGQTAEFLYQITTSGGSATSYALSGALPSGLAFNSATGLISGRPTTPGVSILTLTATGPGGTSQPQTLAITVNPAAGAPVITSPAVADATVGVNFSYTITATNVPATPPFPPGTTLDAVNLPSGLAVNPATGVIQGLPVEVGTTTASLFGTNEAGVGAPRDLVINVRAPAAAPTVNSPAVAYGQAGVAFSYQITATGGPTSFNVSGAPGWLAVNNLTGALTGTPPAPGSFTVELRATNVAGTSAPRPLTLNIAAADGTPVITSTRTAGGQVGTAFAYQIVAAPAATSYQSSALPTGLGLNSTTGQITGTPSVSGSFNVTLSATNASGQGAPIVLVITVAPSATLVLPGS